MTGRDAPYILVAEQPLRLALATFFRDAPPVLRFGWTTRGGNRLSVSAFCGHTLMDVRVHAWAPAGQTFWPVKAVSASSLRNLQVTPGAVVRLESHPDRLVYQYPRPEGGAPARTAIRSVGLDDDGPWRALVDVIEDATSRGEMVEQRTGLAVGDLLDAQRWGLFEDRLADARLPPEMDKAQGCLHRAMTAKAVSIGSWRWAVIRIPASSDLYLCIETDPVAPVAWRLWTRLEWPPAPATETVPPAAPTADDVIRAVSAADPDMARAFGHRSRWVNTDPPPVKPAPSPVAPVATPGPMRRVRSEEDLAAKRPRRERAAGASPTSPAPASAGDDADLLAAFKQALAAELGG